ncbi:MAG TPA: DUF4235 domain-containing protein [Sporichthyaceae bacterium]|jgi:hypothetical protein|nr:DUF4235 domain-containing protein [Sporichthyaceae bacterium]
MAKQDTKLAWKAVTTVAGVVAGLVTKKAVGAGWLRVSGNPPPDPPENPDIALPGALLWAVAAGAAAAVVKVCLTRGAAMSWRGLTGTLPPGLDSPESI